MQLLASEGSADLYTHPPGIVRLLPFTIAYIQAMALHIHTQGRFNNHSLYRIMVMVTNVMGVMKMGNTVPRVRFKSTSLAFWDSVIPLHHMRSLMSPLYPRPPVCAAPCLRGQCSDLVLELTRPRCRECQFCQQELG